MLIRRVLQWAAAAGVVAGAGFVLWLGAQGPEPTELHVGTLGACDGGIDFGEIVQCSIDVSGEEEELAFGGAVGDVVRLRAAHEPVGLDLRARVERPNGTAVCGDTAVGTNFDTFTCVLDTAGVHSVAVHDAGAATGAFNVTIQRLNAPVGCSSIAYGTHVEGSLDELGELDCWRRTNVVVGSVIRVRTVKSFGEFTDVTAVLRPDGTTLCSHPFIEGTCTADVAGTYTFLIGRASTGTGGYGLMIQRLDAAVGCGTIPYGNPPVTGSIDGVAEFDCWPKANVAAGDVLFLKTMETGGTFTAAVEFIRPDGTTRCGGSTDQEVRCTADAAGTYRILISAEPPGETGQYALHLQRLNNPVGCPSISLGTPVSTSISAASEVDCYTFAGVAGSYARLRVIEPDVDTSEPPFQPVAELIRPDGTSVCGTFFPADDVKCQLDVDGNHRILVRDAGSQTGNYAVLIRRFPIGGCTTVAYGNPGLTESIGVPAEMDCYRRANVAVGDRMRVRIAETGGALTTKVEVLRPDGSTLCAAATETDSTCIADTAGTHFFLVFDGAAGTGDYVIAFQRLNNPVGCTGIAFSGTARAGTIDLPVETDCYRVSNLAGDLVRVRLVKTSGALEPLSEVVRPDGTTVCGPSTFDDANCTLVIGGIHTVLVRDNGGSDTGGYSLVVQRLNNPTGCVTIGFGNPGGTGTINAAGELDCYRKTNVAVNDRLWVRTVETSFPFFSAVAEVIRPDGTTVCGPVAFTELTCIADATGTHLFLIRSEFVPGTGDYGMLVQRLNNPAGCTVLGYGDAPLAASLAVGAETDCYRFAGTANDLVRVGVVEDFSGVNPNTEVLRPNGQVECGPTFSDGFSCFLNVTGNQAILVRDDDGLNTGAGNYTIEIDEE